MHFGKFKKDSDNMMHNTMSTKIINNKSSGLDDPKNKNVIPNWEFTEVYTNHSRKNLKNREVNVKKPQYRDKINLYKTMTPRITDHLNYEKSNDQLNNFTLNPKININH